MTVAASRLIAAAIALGLVAACASAPPVAAPPKPAPLAFEQKMGWILRLEEDRLLEFPEPPAPPPLPSPAVPAGGRRPATMGPPAPPPRPSLPLLLSDQDARIRRRTALAIGRTRMPEGIEPLLTVLTSDSDPEVRQMAAFAMGLIGDGSAADALVAALTDADPIVQGRAAEALGLIAHKPAAEAVAAMMAAHIQAGVLNGISPDDLEHPKVAPVEAVRLGIYALVRLGAYDALASVLTDGGSRPISRWWPVAYGFRRIADPRGGTVLLALLQGEGVLTRAFAARGLGVIKDQRALAPLRAALGNASEVNNVRIEAARALGDLGVTEAADTLIKVIATPKVDPNLRLEAVVALGQLAAPTAVDVLVDLVTEPWPSLRAAAFTALARTDPDIFLTVLSGVDPDQHWNVRAALAAALGNLDADRARPGLTLLLKDADQRVVPSALTALVAVKAPEAETELLARLAAEDPVVRVAAANGLARLKSSKGVKALVDSYERAEKDPTYIARAAMLAALVELDPAAAQPLLERALADRDWAVRVRAAALLRKLDPAADVAKIRPAPAAVLPELNDLVPLINPKVSPVAYVDTEKGMIQIELAILDAPRTVTNFISLARRNFLNGTPIHRVVANFVVQDGDPRGDGEGGPAYTIRDEINQRPYLRGAVGMALDWEDTGGSQFFITLTPQPHLDARYTVFGQVVAGMEIVDQLTQWDQIRTVRIWDGANWIGAPE